MPSRAQTTSSEEGKADPKLLAFFEWNIFRISNTHNLYLTQVASAAVLRVHYRPLQSCRITSSFGSSLHTVTPRASHVADFPSRIDRLILPFAAGKVELSDVGWIFQTQFQKIGCAVSCEASRILACLAPVTALHHDRFASTPSHSFCHVHDRHQF
jgi:hypothetical protein